MHAFVNRLPHRQAPLPRRAGFTLIEVLVVLGIIAILASISLVVANRVTESGRERLTSDIIKTLDTAAQTYVSQREKVPATFTDADGYEFPLIDARGTRGTADSGIPTAATALPEPSLQLFLAVATSMTSVDEAIRGIDSKYLERATVNSTAQGRDAMELAPGGSKIALVLPRVKDAWGQPIRFVHPAFHGGYGNYFVADSGTGTYAAGSPVRQPLVRRLKVGVNSTPTEFAFRRSARPFASGTTDIGDADEGLCAGVMPYFYSAGPDKDPGTRDDNVYSSKPSYPSESKAKTN